MMERGRGEGIEWEIWSEKRKNGKEEGKKDNGKEEKRERC